MTRKYLKLFRWYIIASREALYSSRRRNESRSAPAIQILGTDMQYYEPQPGFRASGANNSRFGVQSLGSHQERVPVLRQHYSPGRIWSAELQICELWTREPPDRHFYNDNLSPEAATEQAIVLEFRATYCNTPNELGQHTSQYWQ